MNTMLNFVKLIRRESSSTRSKSKSKGILKENIVKLRRATLAKKQMRKSGNSSEKNSIMNVTPKKPYRKVLHLKKAYV